MSIEQNHTIDDVINIIIKLEKVLASLQITCHRNNINFSNKQGVKKE